MGCEPIRRFAAAALHGTSRCSDKHYWKCGTPNFILAKHHCLRAFNSSERGHALNWRCVWVLMGCAARRPAGWMEMGEGRVRCSEIRNGKKHASTHRHSVLHGVSTSTWVVVLPNSITLNYK